MVDISQFESLLNKVHLGRSPEWFDNIPEETIALTLTSPPYYDTDLYLLEDGTEEFGWKTYEDYKNHLRSVIKGLFDITIRGGRIALVLTNTPQTNANDIVTHLWPLHHDIVQICLDEGWKLKDEIIWKKPRSTYNYVSSGFIPETQLQANHDTISILRKPGEPRLTTSRISLPSVWEIASHGPHHKYNRVYPSFPEKLVKQIIEIWTLPNDIVFDPYAGSGQVVRIAKKLHRLGIGVEIDPQWQQLWKDMNT